MMFFPLVNILGYEFSLVNGIIFFILSAIRAITTYESNSDDSFTSHFKKNKIFLLISIFIPLILGIFSTLLFSECPLGEGILFYLVISIPNLFFGYITGHCISIVLNRFRILTFIIIFLVILLLPLIEFYFNPQVYFYNLIIGFFPGTIYDEDLAVDRLLLSYRIIQFALSLLIIFLAYNVSTKKIKKATFIFTTFLVLLISFIIKPYLSFATNMERLEKNLTGKVKTEHFDILYSNSIDKNSILHLALLHEYYYEQVNQKLELNFKERITSIVFRDANEKRNLIGAGNADIAKPWLKQIYLNFPTYMETLKHEIVHIIAAEFGTTPFKVAENINPAMIEGLAMAIENDYDGYSVDHLAKLAYGSGYKVSMQNLFTGLNFMNNYSSISYIYAGSFIKFLIDKYGVTKVKQLYSNIDFYSMYNKNISILQDEYEAYLKTVEVKYNRNMAQMYFGGKTIFKKHCARTAAYKTKKAISIFNQGNSQEAEVLFNDVYNYSGSYSSLRGLSNSRIKQKKYDIAAKYLSEEAPKFFDSPYKFNLELILGDLYVLNDKYESAKAIYDSLLIQKPSMDYYNEAYVRTHLLKQDPVELKKFILANRKERFNILRSIIDKTVLYEVIPMILYYNSEDAELKNLVLFLQKKLEVFDMISCYAVMRLSQAASRIGYYEIAKELAVKSLLFNDDEMFIHPLTENLKLVNWLSNFSEETLKNILIE